MIIIIVIMHNHHLHYIKSPLKPQIAIALLSIIHVSLAQAY